jgi:peptidoglycan/LPS O-acetylase OafA/YrhL
VLVSIGVVSYGAYIFHLPAAFLIKRTYFHMFGQGLERGPMLFTLGLGLTLIIATASWKLFEEPINSLKWYWPYQTRAVKMIAANTANSSESAD